MFKHLIISSLLILAHSPESPFADWFMSLKQPDHPQVSCCGPADQFYADNFRQSEAGEYKVEVDGQTIIIPENKIDWGRNNPTGRSVIFLMGSEQDFAPFVLCLIPPNSM